MATAGSIAVLPSNILTLFFSFGEQTEDLGRWARVCKQWRNLILNAPFPLAKAYRDRIVFEMVDQTETLPKTTLNLRLKVFTIFKDCLIGEVESKLIFFDPINSVTLKKVELEKPDLDGKFLTSDSTCLYIHSLRTIYEIDPLNQTAKKLPIRFPFESYANCGLIGKKFYYAYRPPNFPDLLQQALHSPYLRENRCALFSEIGCYDLEMQEHFNFSYPTNHPLSLTSSNNVLIMRVKHNISCLNSEFTIIDSTFWQYEAQSIQSFANQLLIKGSYIHCAGDQTKTCSDVCVRERGDRRNYAETRYPLPENTSSPIHPFFIKDIGWKFLQKEGVYWNYHFWQLNETRQLVKISFIASIL